MMPSELPSVDEIRLTLELTFSIRTLSSKNPEFVEISRSLTQIEETLPS